MGRLKETLIITLIGLSISVLLFVFDLISYQSSINIIKEFPVIGTCSFGFLLTMFSLIVQGNNETTSVMRSNKRLFSRFIALNRDVVMFSLATTIYSYIIGNAKFCCANICYLDFATLLFYFLFITFIVANIYFLVIFYMLVTFNTTNND